MADKFIKNQTIIDADWLNKVDHSVSLLNTVILDIGDWDMVTDISVSIPHGLDHTKIRGVSAVIRRDDDLFAHDINWTNNLGTGNHGIDYSTVNAFIIRETGGQFDGAAYTSTGFNRGWITIQYID